MARAKSKKDAAETQPSSAKAGKEPSGDRANTQSNSDFVVVGIGASAGGIQALKEFFENAPVDAGIAYVVILHLSPDHDSRLAQVLQNSTRMPITQVNSATKVERDHVYVISPNKSLSIYDNQIRVSPLRSPAERRAPVDIFFRTLAESHNSRAVAVILSGSGANGSMGLKRIKENGGAAFVQNPREAEFNEMPRNAIATGLADAILPIREIPARIVEYQKSLGLVHLPMEPTDAAEDEQRALREVFSQLRTRTGHDFSNYKRPTLHRRIERRMRVLGVTDLTAYTVLLSEKSEEVQALLKDLLISVTSFFRDEKAWKALEKEVIPRIMRERNAGEQIRAWVVGCATGEEAYSLAILLAEAAERALNPPQFQIFATDIDEQAIATARQGVYSANDAADVSPERLRQYFIHENGSYRIRSDIRDRIIFTNHNVIKGPPFSRLDLVTCRNMLIYLNSGAQERIMETLHFALRPEGFLFIGSSESVDGSADLFVPVDKKMRIYQSRRTSARAIPIPEAIPPIFRSPAAAAITPDVKSANRITFGELHQRLLEQYAPPSIVVDEEHEILHVSDNAGRYLKVTGGEPTNNLLKLVLPELRLELRTSLLQAVQKATNVEVKGLTVDVNGKAEVINVIVRPVLRAEDTARGFLLVIFEPADKAVVKKRSSVVRPDSVAHQLEEELIRAKEQLRTAVEQAELQTEELRASNEEVQAMNEELRSTAEELETGKEELQSMNEELMTVNQELKIKLEELSHANNDFQNLINSTDIGTIFLDRGFRIKLFSPAIRSIFNLLPADVGRPLSDITHRLEYDYLMMDAEAVMDRLHTIEREVRTDDGSIYMLRITPYRTAEDVINGVVMNFVDISAVYRAERHYRSLFEAMGEGLCVVEILRDNTGNPIDFRFLEVNPAFEKQTGFYKVVGRTAKQVMPGLAEEFFAKYGDVSSTGIPARFEAFSDTDGRRWFQVYAYRYGEPEQDQIAMLCEDISDEKRRELNLSIRAEVNDEIE